MAISMTLIMVNAKAFLTNFPMAESLDTYFL